MAQYRVSTNAPALQTELADARLGLSNEANTPVRAGGRAGNRRPGAGPPPVVQLREIRYVRPLIASQRGSTASHHQGNLPNDLQITATTTVRQLELRESSATWVLAVSVGWRPYYNGWSSIHPYGWTWVSYDRWAWPRITTADGACRAVVLVPVDIGRAYVSGRCTRIRELVPAWVNNQPVFALSVGFGNFWAGWTGPRSHFARGPVGQWAVAPDRLGGRRSLDQHATVPVPSARRAQGRRGWIASGAVVPPSSDNRQPIQPRAQIVSGVPTPWGSGFQPGGGLNKRSFHQNPTLSSYPDTSRATREQEDGRCRVSQWWSRQEVWWSRQR